MRSIATKEATIFVRSSLRNGQLVAYIRDPENGDMRQLRDWSPVGGRIYCFEPPYGFDDDFIDFKSFVRDTNTVIRGSYRPIFFRKDEFEEWFEKIFKPSKHPGGRPKGSGAYADEEFLQQMRDLITQKKAKSVERRRPNCCTHS